MSGSGGGEGDAAAVRGGETGMATGAGLKQRLDLEGPGRLAPLSGGQER